MSQEGETSYDWQWDDDDMIPGPYNRDEDDATDETPGDLDFDEVYDDHPWQWTPRTTSFDQDTSDSSMPELQRPDGSVHVPLWLCRNCHSTQWRTHGEGYVCLDCGCPNFYDANLPHSHDTGLGSWTYTPHAPRGETRHDDPRPVGHDARETAESEVPTDDPCVDPSTLQPATRPSRRQRRARKQAAGRDSDSHVPQQPAHTPLRAPVSPGLKYRGGSPPLPPAWDAQKGDLQAFSAGRGSLLFCGAARFEAICPRMRPPCSSS